MPVQDIVPDWQTAASSLLVAIGSKHCNDVMTELLDKFQPGVLPHFFVVQTLAQLATANGKYNSTCRHFDKFVDSDLCVINRINRKLIWKVTR